MLAFVWVGWIGEGEGGSGRGREEGSEWASMWAHLYTACISWF